MRQIISFLFVLLVSSSLQAQTTPNIGIDVNFYDLQITSSPIEKSLKGNNTVYFSATPQQQSITLFLAESFHVDSILSLSKCIPYKRTRSAIIIPIIRNKETEKPQAIIIYYSGKPKEATNPPWDGGFTYAQDKAGRNWTAVSCEQEGANTWWPCIDSWNDEPDSMQISLSVPEGQQAVANGKLIKETHTNHLATFVYRVSNPINTYNVTLNSGNFAIIYDSLQQANGQYLPLTYYVLDYNKKKAETHFEQIHQILSTYEYYFGPYPFPEDGYKVIETPYWGMEHQSAISYGNNYKNQTFGYDFILVHETAHEWWGNSVTASDPGDMWIHEAFATYSEALLAEKMLGYNKAIDYLLEQKNYIKNTLPIAGPLGQNFHKYPDTDMYYKGSWMLHTLRNYIENDSLWFATLLNFSRQFHHKITNREEVITYFSKALNLDLHPFFSQYLHASSLPVFSYTIKNGKESSTLTYRWDKTVENFNMPVDLIINGEDKIRLKPLTDRNQKMEFKIPIQSLELHQSNFLVEKKEK